MKKLLLAGLLVVMLAPAAQADGLGITLGIEGAFVLPVGDWGDATGIGFGGMAKGAYSLNDEMSVALRVGYLYHLSKDFGGTDVSTSELPILVGFRYQTALGLYGDLSLGLVNLGATADVPGVGETSDSEMKFGMLAGVGFNIMSINISANFFAPSLGDVDEVMGLLFIVGYDFVTL
jgi:hypothetical protein